MQQRQLRLGDILDDYCPRERRVTNHAVVAMIGSDVKQTRCTTCEAEHEYKHAKIPRQRRKSDAPAALYTQVAAGAPKRVIHETSLQADDLLSPPAGGNGNEPVIAEPPPVETASEGPTSDAGTLTASVDETATASVDESATAVDDSATLANESDSELDEDAARDEPQDDGPIHRRLIRASLPRPEGQQPPGRPIPEFTIRQPGGGRPNRFRPRHQRGGPNQGHQFGGNRSHGNTAGPMRGQHPGGRPGMGKRHGGQHGRKRSK